MKLLEENCLAAQLGRWVLLPGMIGTALVLIADQLGWFALPLLSLLLLASVWLSAVGLFIWRLMATGSASSNAVALAAVAAPVPELLRRELDGVSTELQRTRALMVDAVQQLSINFQQRDAQARTQSELLQSINLLHARMHEVFNHAGMQPCEQVFNEITQLRGRTCLDDTPRLAGITSTACTLSEQLQDMTTLLSELSTLGVHAHGEIRQAVCFLQFEDIATQSLVLAEAHVQQLSEMNILIEQLIAAFMEPQPDVGALSLAIAQICERVAKRTDNYVPQQTMAVGDVELF